MSNEQWTYYKYRKNQDYPVYVRMPDAFQPKLQHLLTEMGFSLLTDGEVKKIQLHKTHTRILSIQEASSRLMAHINGSDILDQFGLESIALKGGMPVYTYRKVGAMGVHPSKTLWELALASDFSHTDQLIGLRITLVRFLSQALSELGVLSYWGTVKDDQVIIMKQLNSFGEAVFIDSNKGLIFSNGGEVKFNQSLKIVRKDKEYAQKGTMGREELISFLSVSTCLLSFYGITPSMKKAIYSLSVYTSATHSSLETPIAA